MNCVQWTLDSDTTTSMACAIAGARFGVEGIPYTWRGDVELSEHFHELAEKVWQASLDVAHAPAAREKSGAA
jgi:ADP-ribosylglycohydrolase